MVGTNFGGRPTLKKRNKMAYPPSESEARAMFNELKHLDTSTGVEFDARKYEIIHDIAEAHFYKARPYLIRGLDSKDPDYRIACISALVTHWQYKDDYVVSRLFEMAVNDPDEEAQYMAISSLGFLKVEKSLPLLKNIVEENLNKPDWLQKEAYLSILKILHYPPPEIQDLWWEEFNKSTIDMDLLESITDMHTNSKDDP